MKSVNAVPDGKLVFLLVCNSFKNKSLPEAFLEIGYDAVIGFPEPAEVFLGGKFMVQFFYYAIKEDYYKDHSNNSKISLAFG